VDGDSQFVGDKVAHPVVVVAPDEVDGHTPVPAVEERLEKVHEALAHDRPVLEIEVEYVAEENQRAVVRLVLQESHEPPPALGLAGDLAATKMGVRHEADFVARYIDKIVHESGCGCGDPDTVNLVNYQ
jgi:hypothetical protein